MATYKAYPNMKIKCQTTTDGGFVAIVHGTNITSYAYPTSPMAIAARRNPDHAKHLMIEREIDALPAFVAQCGYEALKARADANFRHFIYGT